MNPHTNATTSVRVAVRIRPLSPKEILQNSSECVCPHSQHPSTTVLVKTADLSSFASSSSTNNKLFTFDEVYGAKSKQNDIYLGSVKPLVDRFLEGFNATTLAYGQVCYAFYAMPHNSGF